MKRKYPEHDIEYQLASHKTPHPKPTPCNYPRKHTSHSSLLLHPQCKNTEKWYHSAPSAPSTRNPSICPKDTHDNYPKHPPFPPPPPNLFPSLPLNQTRDTGQASSPAPPTLPPPLSPSSFQNRYCTGRLTSSGPTSPTPPAACIVTLFAELSCLPR